MNSSKVNPAFIFGPENRIGLKVKAQIFTLRQILKQDAPN
jgi:hypothetical protein